MRPEVKVDYYGHNVMQTHEPRRRYILAQTRLSASKSERFHRAVKFTGGSRWHATHRHKMMHQHSNLDRYNKF
jgi:hypothetical protein